MAKVIASVCALLVYGVLGAGSVSGEPFEAFAALTAVAATGAQVEEAASRDTATPVRIGDMSEEEKERRKQVCEREFEHCYDWCSASRRTKYDQKMCYEQECYPKLAECMKKIPS